MSHIPSFLGTNVFDPLYGFFSYSGFCPGTRKKPQKPISSKLTFLVWRKTKWKWRFCRSAEKKNKWHRIELSSGKFLRRFRLPEEVKIDEVKASMENGVLTVNVPKAEEVKPTEIS